MGNGNVPNYQFSGHCAVAFQGTMHTSCKEKRRADWDCLG